MGLLPEPTLGLLRNREAPQTIHPFASTLTRVNATVEVDASESQHPSSLLQAKGPESLDPFLTA
jgi:hypothetical protein